MFKKTLSWLLVLSCLFTLQVAIFAENVPAQEKRFSIADLKTAAPKITKQPTGEWVEAGGSASFIARADGYKSFVWRLVSPDTTNTVLAKDGPSYFSGLQVSGADSDTLTLSNIPASMNNWCAECKFIGEGGTSFTNGAIIHVKSGSTSAGTTSANGELKITKQPTGEWVSSGGTAYFIARAENYKSFVWRIVSPDTNTTYTAADAPNHFSGLQVSGTDSDTLCLSNIPASMNNWCAECKFVGAKDTAYTNGAIIHVNAGSGTAGKSGAPRITKQPTGEWVSSGGTAYFIARAENYTNFVWRIVSPDTNTTYTAADAPNHFSGLQVSGTNSDTLCLSNIPASMNNWCAECKFIGSGGTSYTNGAIIHVNGSSPTQSKTTVKGAPVITKQPTGEWVKSGGSAYFIARADGAKSFVWRIVSPDTNTTYTAAEAPNYFSGLKISGADTDTIQLSNIPTSMNNWCVECKFIGEGGTSYTNGAIIHISK